jgi:hypothetical protein
VIHSLGWLHGVPVPSALRNAAKISYLHWSKGDKAVKTLVGPRKQAEKANEGSLNLGAETKAHMPIKKPPQSNDRGGAF